METVDISPQALAFVTDSGPFRALDRDDIEQLSRYLISFDVAAGKTLLHEGDKGNYMAQVTAGELQVVKENSGHEDVVIATLGAGGIIGEMSIVDQRPRSATIRALTDSTLVVLTRENFGLMKRDQPDICIALLAEIARDLSLKLRRMSEFAADIRL